MEIVDLPDRNQCVVKFSNKILRYLGILGNLKMLNECNDRVPRFASNNGLHSINDGLGGYVSIVLVSTPEWVIFHKHHQTFCQLSNCVIITESLENYATLIQRKLYYIYALQNMCWMHESIICDEAGYDRIMYNAIYKETILMLICIYKLLYKMKCENYRYQIFLL